MNAPPSVLFVLPWSLSAAGGVNQVVINLARETARRGRLRPIVFCADWSQEHFSSSEIGGITVINGRLRAPLADEHAARTLLGFLLGLRHALRSWLELIRQHNVQIVNPHYVGLSCFLFPLLRILGRARVHLTYSLHGADVTAIRQSGIVRRALARWMLRQADSIVCVSDDLTRHTQKSLGLGKRQVLTIYNGIDVDELEQSQSNAFRPDTGSFDSYLINVATYEYKKGQDVLLRAYTQLLHEGLKSALVLIGRSTPHLVTLRNLVRQLGLQAHVFFVPDLDHARTLAAIRQARLLVQPSREEPFGITLLEAGYLGTPIVATRSGGIPEVLGSYYPYLVKADDPAALAAAIDEVMFNPTESARQVKLIKRRVSTQFTWGTAYRSYESLWTGNT